MGDVWEVIGIVTIGLIAINAILLVYGLIKKRIKLLQGLFIVAAAILIPYGIAYMCAASVSGWAGLDRAILGFVYTGFVLMLIVLIFLIKKIKLSINKV